MASKYNEAKIFEQINKLSANEAFILFDERLRKFVTDKLKAEQSEVDEVRNELENKINKLKGN